MNIFKSIANRMSIKYVEGYPTSLKSFAAIIKSTENELIFVKQLTGVEQFRINKNDILNIDCRHDDSRKFNKDFIVLKVNYKGNPIELILQCGDEPSKEYNKLYSLIYGSTISNYKSGFSTKQPFKPSSIVLFLVGIILVIVGFNVINSSSKSSQATTSKPMSSQSSNTSTSSGDNANLQTDLRNKLKDNAIQVEDSTDTTGYILIKNKCQADTRGRISYETYLMLNEARKRPEYKKCNKIGVMITADLTDKYGNTSNDKVYMQDFNKSELDKVNWDNIDESNMDTIGEQPWYHSIIKLDK